MQFQPLKKETPDNPIIESFAIEQGDNNYILNIELYEDKIILNISEEYFLKETYENKFSLEKLKTENKAFSKFSSLRDLIECLKKCIDNKTLSINKKIDNKIIIELKENGSSLELIKKDITFNLKTAEIINKQYSRLMINMKNLEKKYDNIIKENSNMKREIKEIQEENKRLMEKNENLMNDNIKLNVDIINLNETFKKELKYLKEDILKKQNKIIKSEFKKFNENPEIIKIKKMEKDIIDMKKDIKNLFNKNDDLNCDIKTIEKNIQILNKNNNFKNFEANDKEMNIKNDKINLVYEKKRNIKENHILKRNKYSNRNCTKENNYLLNKQLNNVITNRNKIDSSNNSRNNTRTISRNKNINRSEKKVLNKFKVVDNSRNLINEFKVKYTDYNQKNNKFKNNISKLIYNNNNILYNNFEENDNINFKEIKNINNFTLKNKNNIFKDKLNNSNVDKDFNRYNNNKEKFGINDISLYYMKEGIYNRDKKNNRYNNYKSPSNIRSNSFDKSVPDVNFNNKKLKKLFNNNKNIYRFNEEEEKNESLNVNNCLIPNDIRRSNNNFNLKNIKIETFNEII